MGIRPLVFFFCLILIDDLEAQSNADGVKELRIGYGLFSDVWVMGELADTYNEISSGISGVSLNADYVSRGPFIIRYDMLVTRRISLGPELNLVGLKRTEWYSSGEIMRDRFFFLNLSARFDYCYVSKEKVRMYSGLALGPAYIFEASPDDSSDDRSGFFITYQLNFFGIRFGGEWGGYAEFGFGRNGILNAGISKRF